jgi:hypothetical protein
MAMSAMEHGLPELKLLHNFVFLANSNPLYLFVCCDFKTRPKTSQIDI